MIEIVSVERLKNFNKKNSVIIDVRTEMEHASKHLKMAHEHVPLDVLSPHAVMDKLSLGKEAEVYLMCRSGKRAVIAAEKFIEEGYMYVKVIEGGILACETSGVIPLENGFLPGEGLSSGDANILFLFLSTLSLPRQVQLFTGFFVVLFSFLSLTWTTFTVVLLAIGLGLILLAMQGKDCYLSSLLQKAPWNKHRHH